LETRTGSPGIDIRVMQAMPRRLAASTDNTTGRRWRAFSGDGERARLAESPAPSGKFAK
jgi:hypothetical protein